jgi:hypothetical protein
VADAAVAAAEGDAVADADGDSLGEIGDHFMYPRIVPIGLLPLIIGGICTLTGCSSGSRQLSFTTPEAAAEALHDACRNRDREQLKRIFGPDMEKLASGDHRQDQADFQRFAAAFDRKFALRRASDERAYLVVGEQAWEFPAPIVNEQGKWRFDTEHGIEQMEDVRVGNNELSAIRACDAYVQAQHEYFNMNPEGAAVKSYAAKIRSSPGRRDGLWWPDSPEAPRSPLGPLVAAAVQRGELDTSAAQARQPYRGYYFKPLVRQSASANGGAKEYMDASGRMTNGFGLIAWPAVYDKTGVMTFVVSQDGVVFQRDLGSETARVAENAMAFDPSGWDPLAPP